MFYVFDLSYKGTGASKYSCGAKCEGDNDPGNQLVHEISLELQEFRLSGKVIYVKNRRDSKQIKWA